MQQQAYMWLGDEGEEIGKEKERQSVKEQGTGKNEKKKKGKK